MIRQYLNTRGVVTGDKTVPKYPGGVVTGGRAGTSFSLHKSLVLQQRSPCFILNNEWSTLR